MSKAVITFLKSRYMVYYILTLALIGWMTYAYPAQTQVVLWKLCLLFVAITVGIHLSRVAIIVPIERRNAELLDNTTVSAAICIARAMVIIACVIAVCLGV